MLSRTVKLQSKEAVLTVTVTASIITVFAALQQASAGLLTRPQRARPRPRPRPVITRPRPRPRPRSRTQIKGNVKEAEIQISA